MIKLYENSTASIEGSSFKNNSLISSIPGSVVGGAIEYNSRLADVTETGNILVLKNNSFEGNSVTHGENSDPIEGSQVTHVAAGGAVAFSPSEMIGRANDVTYTKEGLTFVNSVSAENNSFVSNNVSSKTGHVLGGALLFSSGIASFPYVPNKLLSDAEGKQPELTHSLVNSLTLSGENEFSNNSISSEKGMAVGGAATMLTGHTALLTAWNSTDTGAGNDGDQEQNTNQGNNQASTVKKISEKVNAQNHFTVNGKNKFQGNSAKGKTLALGGALAVARTSTLPEFNGFGRGPVSSQPVVSATPSLNRLEVTGENIFHENQVQSENGHAYGGAIGFAASGATPQAGQAVLNLLQAGDESQERELVLSTGGLEYLSVSGKNTYSRNKSISSNGAAHGGAVAFLGASSGSSATVQNVLQLLGETSSTEEKSEGSLPSTSNFMMVQGDNIFTENQASSNKSGAYGGAISFLAGTSGNATFLVQASQSMLAQANQTNQGAIDLLKSGANEAPTTSESIGISKDLPGTHFLLVDGQNRFEKNESASNEGMSHGGAISFVGQSGVTTLASGDTPQGVLSLLGSRMVVKHNITAINNALETVANNSAYMQVSGSNLFQENQSTSKTGVSHGGAIAFSVSGAAGAGSTANSMLAQANQQPQGVLSLLQSRMVVQHNITAIKPTGTSQVVSSSSSEPHLMVQGSNIFNQNISSSEEKASYGGAISFNLAPGVAVESTKTNTENIQDAESTIRGLATQTKATEKLSSGHKINRADSTATGIASGKLTVTGENVFASNSSVSQKAGAFGGAISVNVGTEAGSATEMVQYSKNNILTQAGQSMLAQANQSAQDVLRSGPNRMVVQHTITALGANQAQGMTVGSAVGNLTTVVVEGKNTFIANRASSEEGAAHGGAMSIGAGVSPAVVLSVDSAEGNIRDTDIAEEVSSASSQKNISTNGLSANSEKLSSGYKINRAGDDAAGLTISTPAISVVQATITGENYFVKNAASSEKGTAHGGAISLRNSGQLSSAIRDTDMAEEMVEYTKNEILQQSAQSLSAKSVSSSGKPVNRAGDDAAGLAVSEKMRTQIQGLRKQGSGTSVSTLIIEGKNTFDQNIASSTQSNAFGGALYLESIGMKVTEKAKEEPTDKENSDSKAENATPNDANRMVALNTSSASKSSEKLSSGYKINRAEEGTPVSSETATRASVEVLVQGTNIFSNNTALSKGQNAYGGAIAFVGNSESRIVNDEEVGENLTAAESKIRDTDMASEMARIKALPTVKPDSSDTNEEGKSPASTVEVSLDKASGLLVINGDNKFLGNKAIAEKGKALGGAIYNEAKTILGGTTVFAGNTANDKLNDIHNAGELSLGSDQVTHHSTSLEGGVDGAGSFALNQGELNLASTATIKQSAIKVGTLTQTNVTVGENNVIGKAVDHMSELQTRGAREAIIHGSDSVVIQDAAKLKVAGAQAGNSYLVAASDKALEAGADSWADKNLEASSALLNLKRVGEDTDNNSVVVAATFNPSGLPDVDIPNIIEEVSGKLDPNSSNPAIQFLSRATDTAYLDKSEMAKTINSAAEIALIGGVKNVSYTGAGLFNRSIEDHLSLMRTVRLEDNVKLHEDDHVDLWVDVSGIMQRNHGMDVHSKKTGAGNNSFGLDIDLGGIVVGADRSFGNGAHIGLAGTAGKGKSKSRGGDYSKTKNDVDFYGVSLYGGYDTEKWNVLGNFSYTHFRNDLRQDLASGMQMGGQVKAKVNSDVFSLGAKAEYKFAFDNGVNVVPHVGLRWDRLVTKGFDTKVQGQKVFRTAKDTQDILSIPVGIGVQGDFRNRSDWTIRPQADLSLILAAGDVKDKTKVKANGLSAVDTLETRIVDRTSIGGKLGVDFQKGNVSVGIHYNGMYSSKQHWNGVTAKVVYKF